MKTRQLEQEFIERLKSGDTKALKVFYITNYPKVEQFILQNNGSAEYAKDIYQEAFLAVWQKIRTGNFSEPKPGSINGFLYQIAKNKWTDHLRSAYYKKTSELTDTYMENASMDNNTVSDPVEEEYRLKRTMQAFKGMGEDCKALLKRFYFEKKSLREIADIIGIDEASARNKKYRCMQKLRELTLNTQQ